MSDTVQTPPESPAPLLPPPPAAVKSQRGTVWRVAGLLAPERPQVIAITLLTTLSVALLVAGPWLLGKATDTIFEGFVGAQAPAGMSKDEVLGLLRLGGNEQLAKMISGVDFIAGVGIDFGELGRILAWTGAAYGLSAVANWVQAHILIGVVQRTVYRLREEAEEKLGRLPLKYFDTHPHGDILSRVTNDIDNFTTSLQDVLSGLLTNVLTVVGVTAVMFWISPPLALVALFTLPIVIVVAAFIAIQAKPHFVENWDRTGELTGQVEETYAGHELLAAYGRQESVVEDFTERSGKLRDAGFRAQWLSGVILPVTMFIGNVNYVAVAAFGGFQVASGAITIGAVQTFIQYSKRFTTPIAQVASQINMLQSGIASADRVFEYLDTPEQPELAADQELRNQRTPVGTEARSIRFENVGFRYDPDVPLIEDLDLEAKPGQTVAIVGPTGAGKTTVVNLLIRFYEIDSGTIRLDGVDYRELSRDQVRSAFGMVLQDTWLFHGTIRENIAYGRENASDEDVAAAAKAAYVDDFVSTLPDGYDTVLDSDATNISAGQKQLLTIARAFLADPGVLILDEATSSVDTRTEVLIQEAMARLQAGRTSFVIAHRLSTIRSADTIVVMQAGRVVEQGSHEELIRRKGLYHNLYQSQWTQGADPDDGSH
ncbi:ABC transporter ATP-binding protein/permease [Kineosporia rhizophila]|uniref:ABC transporter ATP-binding protein n=1 Tax=Kineosporia rhizophila TaxID=84633 RepID=UPI001E2F2E83|nr:ABC transporter ATP-binding protein/permease [Kineosporia rhizophila]